MFNRPAPPHFQGFDHLGQFHNHERKLPHWRQPGATYFVTFRLADSLPRNVLDYLARVRHELYRLGSDPAANELRERYERESTQQIETVLDEGHGCCVLQDSDNARIVRECLEYGLGERHWLGCAVIMSNHCHIVIRPLGTFGLDELLQKIKGISARRINQRSGTQGSLWEAESYDRIIRDKEHLYRVIQYIGRNPTKCGQPRNPETCWVHPLWIDAGWNFEELLP